MKKITNEIAVNKVKRNKTSGGLSLEFVEHIENKDGSVENKEWGLKYDAVPHNDLLDGLYDLKQYLASCYGMLDISTVMKAKGLQAGAKEAFKKVQPHLDKMMQERLMKLEVNGYSVSGSIQGEKDKRAVIILGTFTHPNGSKTALNSPLIKFNQDEFKFEGDVKVIIDNLEDEVKQYVNGEKRNAPELFTDTPSDTLETEEMKVA
jgi:hypothetical protein